MGMARLHSEDSLSLISFTLLPSLPEAERGLGEVHAQAGLSFHALS